MRKILFRGKRLDNGEWVEGFYIGKTDPLLEVSYHYIVAQHGKESFVTWHPVDPETVGQFTGLTDKNGTKIFEGDILKYQINIKTAIVGKIGFICGAFVFESDELDRECDIAFSTFADDEIALSQHCIEIIGNIHDNPELMETA